MKHQFIQRSGNVTDKESSAGSHTDMIVVILDQAVGGKFIQTIVIIGSCRFYLFRRQGETSGHLLPVQRIVTHQRFDHLTGNLFVPAQLVSFRYGKRIVFDPFHILVNILAVLGLGGIQLADSGHTESIHLSGCTAGTIALEVTMQTAVLQRRIQFIILPDKMVQADRLVTGC